MEDVQAEVEKSKETIQMAMDSGFDKTDKVLREVLRELAKLKAGQVSVTELS